MFLAKTIQISIPHNKLSRAMSVLATSLKYTEFGEPVNVIKICQEEISEPKSNELLVKILAAPINPADINTIQGKYPIKPAFPATGGNEGVAEIISVGADVKSLKTGDRVIPFEKGIGTWTSHTKYTEDKLLKVPKNVGVIEACTATVNPCTAYRMLKDFKTLQPGDTIIQNGANSAVGQAVHQLCKAWNISSVGVVRDRPDIEKLREYLKSLGATEILTEEQLRTTDLFKTKLNKPKLAFNCVGGKSATEISRHLDNKGVMVTYGGMSREPITVPTAALIFKDISFTGYWMSRWTVENFRSDEWYNMFSELFNMMLEGSFKAPNHEIVSIKDYKTALSSTLNFKGFTGKKFIFDLQK